MAIYGNLFQQYFWSHKQAIRGRRIVQFVMAEGHNIWIITVARISDNPDGDKIYNHRKWIINKILYMIHNLI